MKRKQNGFVFIETIVVTCFLIVSLMVLYTLFVVSNNNELRRLRYDDTPNLYETYYVYQYLDSFLLNDLAVSVQENHTYEVIYPGRTDIFGNASAAESIFFESLWTELGIQNIYVIPATIQEILTCSNNYESLCANTNLVGYLNTLDDADGYYFIIEFARSREGGVCTDDDCVYSYSYYGMQSPIITDLPDTIPGEEVELPEDPEPEEPEPPEEEEPPVEEVDPCTLPGADPIECNIIDKEDPPRCPEINADGSIEIVRLETDVAYICSAPDDYGTSYYYRGTVTNNYVYFAGFYWRIVRINGDGSVRIIYDGTVAHANGDDSSDKYIGKSYYNYFWKSNNLTDLSNALVFHDNAGIGYMYGNRNIATSTTININQAQENVNDSDIKDTVDAWYQVKDMKF